MADNVTIPTTGSGTATPVIATDDVGGVQYQRFKLSLGADGAAADAGSDANRGLHVAAHLHQVNIPQTPTVTSGAYIVDDVIGGLLTFANAARFSGGTGILQNVTVMCKSPLVAATVPALELWLFNQTFTAITDNAAWAPSDADMANYIGHIPIASWGLTGNNVAAVRFGLGFGFSLAGTSLFGQLVTRTAVTLTSTSDIIIGLQILQD